MHEEENIRGLIHVGDWNLKFTADGPNKIKRQKQRSFERRELF